MVVDDAHGLAALTALDTTGDLLDDTRAEVLLDLELGVLGELECIGLVLHVLPPDEDVGEAVADDVVKEHQVALATLVTQTEEAPKLAHGYL